MNQHTLQIKAVTEPVLLARIAVLLRKYDITIDQVNRDYHVDGTEQLTLQVRNLRDNLLVAVNKLERLVPIISLTVQ